MRWRSRRLGPLPLAFRLSESPARRLRLAPFATALGGASGFSTLSPRASTRPAGAADETLAGDPVAVSCRRIPSLTRAFNVYVTSYGRAVNDRHLAG